MIRRVLTAALVALSLGCTAQEQAAVERQGAGAMAASRQAQEVVYVDVRTPAEYASGHVEGAIHIPHDEMASRWQELEPYRDREMVVYCRTGRRSGLALNVLKQHGFTNARNGGGIDQVAARGAPPIVTQ